MYLRCQCWDAPKRCEPWGDSPRLRMLWSNFDQDRVHCKCIYLVGHSQCVLVFPLFIHVYTTSVKTCPLNVHPSCLFRPVHCLFRLVHCLTKYWNVQGRLVKWSSATDTNDYNQKRNRQQLFTNIYWAWGINECYSIILQVFPETNKTVTEK